MRKLPWLMLLLAGRAAAAGPPAAELIDRLSEPAVLRGNFAQSRQIAGFQRPVESSGTFVVARESGLLWHTLRPFESLLSVNDQRLRISNAGQPALTLDTRREPMLRTINGLLQSVVAGDIAALQSRFDLQIQLVGEKGWTLSLRPREAALKERFPAIELSGAAHVEAVTLREQSGDVTTIRFSGQVEADHLTEVEAGQLR